MEHLGTYQVPREKLGPPLVVISSSPNMVCSGSFFGKLPAIPKAPTTLSDLGVEIPTNPLVLELL